jgi:hypothetical protein
MSSHPSYPSLGGEEMSKDTKGGKEIKRRKDACHRKRQNI